MSVLRWEKFRRRYKYRTTAAYEHRLHFDVRRWFPCAVGLVAAVPGFLDLYADGWLVFHVGYAWDGASGLTIDTESSMRGSLVHDGLYQLIREDLLPREAKDEADRELRVVCIEDGMWRFRAGIWEWAVNRFGFSAL